MLRALVVLELLAASDGLPAGVIAARAGIPRSSAYQLLAALAETGYLDVRDGAWSLGPAAARLRAGAPATDHLVALLEAFDRAGPELTEAEVAARSAVDLSVAHGGLVELERVRLVERTEAGGFRLGLRLAALSARIAPLEGLRAAARPHLARVRDETGETASLLVADGERILYLDQVESRHALRHTGWAGRAIPRAGTAGGLALDHPGTCQVVEDAVEAGVLAVAQAVRGSRPSAAISVIGPTARIGGARLTAVRAAVRRAASALGHSPAP